jgi:hypothetical protein
MDLLSPEVRNSTLRCRRHRYLRNTVNRISSGGEAYNPGEGDRDTLYKIVRRLCVLDFNDSLAP